MIISFHTNTLLLVLLNSPKPRLYLLKVHISVADKKKIKLEATEVSLLNGADGIQDKKENETNDSEMFRCETCGATFRSLVLFMDHKNTRCDTGMEYGWQSSNSIVLHTHT